MRLSLICSALAAGLALSTAAAAQDAAAPPQLKSGEWVRTKDGASIGRVEYVDKAKDGSPQGVAVIYDMRIVHIPASSLSAGDKGYLTSLTRSEVARLK